MRTRFEIEKHKDTEIQVVNLYLEENVDGVSLMDNEGWTLLSINHDGKLYLASGIDRDIYDMNKDGRLKIHKD